MGEYFDKHTMMVVVVKLVLGSIFYTHGVVVYNTYSMYTKMGGGTHSARRYRRDCVGIQFIKIYKPSVTATGFLSIEQKSSISS